MTRDILAPTISVVDRCKTVQPATMVAWFYLNVCNGARLLSVCLLNTLLIVDELVPSEANHSLYSCIYAIERFT